MPCLLPAWAREGAVILGPQGFMRERSDKTQNFYHNCSIMPYTRPGLSTLKGRLEIASGERMVRE